MKRKHRLSVSAGLLLIAGLGLGLPAAAQSFGDDVVSCVVNSARSLGQFPTAAAAVEAARESGVGSGYVLASVDGRRIAIDSGFVAHAVTEVPCSGSGPGMKKPG